MYVTLKANNLDLKVTPPHISHCDILLSVLQVGKQISLFDIIGLYIRRLDMLRTTSMVLHFLLLLTLSTEKTKFNSVFREAF